MTTRLNGCCRAMAARHWKKCSLTLRADGDKARPRNEQEPRDHPRRYRCELLAQPRLRHGAALLVPAAFVVATHSRSDLLADGADADVGFSAALHFTERGIFCP